jgi:pimeloyl-ACP methyl ester carboxylesterase
MSCKKLHALLVGCIILFISLIPIISIASYYALFSLRLSYPEASRSVNNTIYQHTTFSECADWTNTDTSQYFFDQKKHPHTFKEVTFKSRDDIDIHGWLLMHDDKIRPVIVMVHGFRLSKNHFTILLPSHMLFNHGYDILSIDLRNHGQSFKTSSLMATFGHSEHLDVLGAIDYLYQHNITDQVGVYGASMGGATSLIATAQDDRILATFVDSPVCDGEDLVYHHISSITGSYIAKFVLKLTRMFAIYSGGLFPPFEYNPISSLKKMKNRPVHFEHTDLDVIVPLRHSQQCSKLANETGAIVTTYFASSGGKTTPKLFNNCWDHCVNMLSDPASYEKRITEFFAKHIPITKT